ncbi:2-hydroxychromene-2-carboxylate isomerase [Parvularcula sp. IMCC14364]|uniref:2-hydroxychromene-2-carboxylate isomerase n=1 Tax=Parvularcula sp. IMCC14364 TaxID=3067902 RepID=UPI0027408CF7|nr:DsbA family protein [Parvularcula sp. IMCC14364]
MQQNVDVYWSFRSPYSYLAVPQLRQLKDDLGVAVTIRPVYPLAVRDVSFFTNRRPQTLPYMMLDMVREAARLNAPFRWPMPDPIVQDTDTLDVAKEQPRIDRLMRLGAIAQNEKGAAAFSFFEEVSAIIWNGQTDNWHEGDHLAEAAARAGFDLAAMEKTAAEEDAMLQKLIEENEAEQQKYHWGVPLMVLNGEGFFGQDRMPALRWRLETLKN